MTDRSDRAGGDGPTGVEAARVVEQYLTMRSTLDDGDAANIIHILSEAGVRFAPLASPPSGNVGERVEPVAWRYRNDLGEVVSEWIDGPVPEYVHDSFTDERIATSSMKIDRAFAAPPQPAPDALRSLLEALLPYIRAGDVSKGEPSFYYADNVYAALSAPVQSGVRGDREAINQAADEVVWPAPALKPFVWNCIETRVYEACDGTVWRTAEQATEQSRKARALSPQSTGDQRPPQADDK